MHGLSKMLLVVTVLVTYLWRIMHRRIYEKAPECGFECCLTHSQWAFVTVRFYSHVKTDLQICMDSFLKDLPCRLIKVP